MHRASRLNNCLLLLSSLCCCCHRFRMSTIFFFFMSTDRWCCCRPLQNKNSKQFFDKMTNVGGCFNHINKIHEDINKSQNRITNAHEVRSMDFIYFFSKGTWCLFDYHSGPLHCSKRVYNITDILHVWESQNQIKWMQRNAQLKRRLRLQLIYNWILMCNKCAFVIYNNTRNL